MPFAAIVQRIRSFSLSIGQLTFGSFLLVLAVIMMTSIASVVAIRHIDTTFAELQRLQSVGDLAEEIDRRMNELRLAARDYVTDPEAHSTGVWDAASALNVLLRKTRLELDPEQREMIDGVAARLSTYRSGIERVTALIARRDELIAALPPLREIFEKAVAKPRKRRRPRPCSTRKAGSPRRCWRTIRPAPSSRPRTCAPCHRRATCSQRGRGLCRGDHFAFDRGTPDRRSRPGGARHRGPPDRARNRAAARTQRQAGTGAVQRFARTLAEDKMAKHRAWRRRRPDRIVRGAVHGAPDRAAAQGHRDRDPFAGRRREGNVDSGDRCGQRDRRHRACRRSIPPHAGRCRRRARGRGSRAGRAAAGRGKLSQAVRRLRRRHLCDDAGRPPDQRQSGTGADDGLRHAARI